MKTVRKKESCALGCLLLLAGCGAAGEPATSDGVGGASSQGQGGGNGAGAGGSSGGVGGGNGGGVDAGGMLPGVDGGNNPPPVTPVAGHSTGGKCFPLCVSSSATSGDYGYENGQSCIVASTYTATITQPCTVGMPVPPPGHPAGTAGVVVSGTCMALCGTGVRDAADATPTDGFGWEFEDTCVIRGSMVANTSLACTTGSPIGDAAATTGAPGRLLGDACTRLCTVTTTDPMGPTGPGYGFEFGASCVIPGTAAALKGIDCKVGVPEPTGPPITLNPNPPAGQVRKPAGMLTRGFFVTGGRLYDKFGNDFVPRGLNNPDIWFDTGDQYLAYNALDNIAAYGANTVRIVWDTSASGTPALLRRIVRRVVEQRMVPMIELHDVTGGTSNQNLLTMVAYYTSAPVKAILTDFEEFLLINIANEWSGSDFRGGYQAAVSAMRSAGLNHTLVIDGNGFGQNANVLFADGPALLTADPQHNLLFSVHMYEVFSGTAGRARITSTLQQAVTAQLPFIVGEFGAQAGNPVVSIDAGFIISECVRLRLGYLGWSWKGNGASLSFLDIALDWEGTQLSSWGSTLIRGTGGLMSSAAKATIYTQ